MRQGHLNGIVLRAKILKALITQGNDSMLTTILSHLEPIGVRYDGVKANVDPFTFNNYISKGGTHFVEALQTLDFSACKNHNYFEGMDEFFEDWSSEPEVARFLGQLAFQMKATRVLEIGCFVGLTTAHLAQALSYVGQNGTVYGIDVNKRFLDTAQKNLQALGLSHFFQPIHGASVDTSVVKCLPDDLNLVFIDSYHDFLNTSQEIEVYSKKLSLKGIIILHDSIKWPGVRKAIALFAEKFHILTFATSNGNGLSVMTKRPF